MFSKLEFLIAFRYLKSKRSEGFISVTAIFSLIGIMIGVATLIIVMSVMNGFRYELVNRILGINSHLTIYSSGGKIANYDEIISKIKKHEDVIYVNPLVEAQVMMSSGKVNRGGLVKGINLDDLKNKPLISGNLVSGDVNNLKQKNGIIIGIEIARSLGLDQGDKLKLISANSNQTIIGSIPRIKTYEIVGIFDSGMYEYDSTTIFMNFQMAQTHFSLKGSASAIEIFAKSSENLDSIKSTLRSITFANPKLYVNDWQQANASFIEALKVERTAMFVILTLIILVAAFNIISSMIMLVGDKRKNIALLRTIGMGKYSITRIFFICGSAIGFVGTLIGTIIGVLFSANINSIKEFLESLTSTDLFNPAVYFLSTLPAKIFLSDVALITIMALAISFLATIYPAYKASKASPAEILRYE